ncbi:hypothetical protein [Luteolibacter sp. Populi]|uniref:hypothetical protein n=1 Tax=Luteolibacter sp. Populi TaxID=3230487 RepID=UPI003465AEF6
MKYQCVTYPHFEPNHTWLRQILLFADEVHRIVPPHEKLEDSKALKRLMDCCDGAVHRCSPLNHIEISKLSAKVFGQALDHPRFLKIAREEKIKITIDRLGEQRIAGWEFLHVEKIGTHVRSELTRRGMLKSFIEDSRWLSVPRGVSTLVMGMIAEKIAASEGFDAITDQPLAFALNGVNSCGADTAAQIDGIIASAIATFNVPKDISYIPEKEYAELRERNSDARAEFARMVRELKSDHRLDRTNNLSAKLLKIENITSDIGKEMEKFRKSKFASKFHEWIPFHLTSLFPIVSPLLLGPLPGFVTGGFSFSVNLLSKLTKKTPSFQYPKVLQTLCSTKKAAEKAALKHLAK